MEWRDLASKVGAMAPVLGTLLGGPIGTAISVGAMVARQLGMPEGSKPDEVLLKLADPETAAKLRELEIEHKEHLEVMFLEQLKIEADDRASARARSMVNADELRRTFWFAVAIFVGVIGIEAGLIFSPAPLVRLVPPEILGRILGTLDAVLLTATYFIFGSSAGSIRKDHA